MTMRPSRITIEFCITESKRLATCLRVLIAASLCGVAPWAPAAAGGELLVDGATAVYDGKTNTISYSGGVEASLEGMRLQGDQLVVQMVDEVATSITTVGEPARFIKDVDAPREEGTRARATTIVYYPRKNTLELKGQAVLTQGNNEIASPSIRYNIEEDAVQAGGDAGASDQRVRIQLNLPEQARSDEEPPSDKGRR